MTAEYSIGKRIEALREEMKKNNIHAYIIYSGDGHLGEYTPEHWKGREWISGFNGSAGKVVITADKAGLWTDSRYFLQANEQLKNTPIKLYKEEVAGYPTFEEFLVAELQAGEVVGLDGNCVSAQEIASLRKNLSSFDIKIDTSHDLLNAIWIDRPLIPTNPFFIHPEEYSGEATHKRIERIREHLAKKGANATIITTLDELAWAFNVRGKDVDCNPVGVAYGIITRDRAILFTLPEKISVEVKDELEKEHITIMPYEEIEKVISSLSVEDRLFIDKAKINGRLFDAIPANVPIIEGASVLGMLKSYKNKTEIQCIHRAMHTDGVALTRFFKWLENALAEGKTFTEYEIEGILASFRAKDPDYVMDSFDTITGYMGHGAIVHYHATPESSYTIENKGVLLLDSGAQYVYGTTDITRTIALGTEDPDPMLKDDYTLVMKGHIAIATCQFPEGTRGNQIDILARKALWDRGLSYGHGTGHGVGVALNVHEGPQNIRTDNNPTPMAVGTFTSNEPGIYRADRWGIRIENLILTVEKCNTEFGQFLGFDTVTLCYFDNRLINKALLTEEEISWYNAYQQHVYNELSPLLTVEEAAWLKEKTAAI